MRTHLCESVLYDDEINYKFVEETWSEICLYMNLIVGSIRKFKPRKFGACPISSVFFTMLSCAKKVVRYEATAKEVDIYNVVVLGENSKR